MSSSAVVHSSSPLLNSCLAFIGRADSVLPETDPVLRRACDRCHAQKLSCQRSTSSNNNNNNGGGGPCTRCVRANATCTSSPSMRNRRSGPVPRPPSPVGHESSPRRTKRQAAERRARAPSTLRAEISDTMTKSIDEAICEMLRTPGEGHHQYFPEGTETLDWMDGVTHHALRALDGHDTHSATSPNLEWESSANAFSTADLHLSSLLLQTPAATPDNNYCVLPRLGAVTPLSSSIISREGGGDVLLEPRGRVSNSKANDPDTSAWSASTFAPTSSSLTATMLDTRADSNSSFSDRTPSSSLPVPSREPHTQTDGQWLQKLVEINVQLFNHANQTMNEAPSVGNSNSARVNDSSSPDPHQNPAGNGFDETLVLSLRFIQALRKLHGTSSRDLPAHTTASPTLTLDPGTTLIIYSCYIRVLELVIDRLGVIRGTLNAATADFSSRSSSAGSSPVNSGVPPLALPTLVACSCSLDEYPILRLRMTLELVEEILDVMSALLLSVLRGAGGRQRQEEEQAMPWRAQSLMPEVSQQALLAREESAYQIIRDIRRELKTSRRAMM